MIYNLKPDLEALLRFKNKAKNNLLYIGAGVAATIYEIGDAITTKLPDNLAEITFSQGMDIFAPILFFGTTLLLATSHDERMRAIKNYEEKKVDIDSSTKNIKIYNGTDKTEIKYSQITAVNFEQTKSEKKSETGTAIIHIEKNYSGPDGTKTEKESIKIAFLKEKIASQLRQELVRTYM